MSPDLKFCVLFYRILYEGGGLILHVCQYVFQNHLKSRKIYNYIHDQLNTRHYIIIFLGFFLRGGPGAQNSSLTPSARYPRYATVLKYIFISTWCTWVLGVWKYQSTCTCTCTWPKVLGTYQVIFKYYLLKSVKVSIYLNTLL